MLREYRGDDLHFLAKYETQNADDLMTIDKLREVYATNEFNMKRQQYLLHYTYTR